MKAILRKVEKKSFEVKKGNNKGAKFEKIEFTCDVIYGDNKVRQLQGSYSVDFAREYFTHAKTITGKKMLEYIGDEVEVITEKKVYERKDGGNGVYEYIKFLNVLDEEGKAIKMPKKDEDSGLDEF